jgi:hypothetical protein
MGANPSVLRGTPQAAPLVRQPLNQAIAHRDAPRVNVQPINLPPDYVTPAAREAMEAEERWRVRNPFYGVAPSPAPSAAPKVDPRNIAGSLRAALTLK